MFITFCQNNSGGYFIQDKNVDQYVIIEGNTLKEILNKANDIFKNYRDYCPCCGERWNDDYMTEEHLDEEPMIYGESVYSFRSIFYDESKAIIYRLNGEKEFVEIYKEVL